MLHGEAAIFVFLHPEPPVSRDLECIRKINVMTELNLGPLFRRKQQFLQAESMEISDLFC